ncbi:endonuclease III [Desulfoplanes formicivorans]|uniref:Endonuclease III n=1 Tax=Desulfoplanes formicivorans TaxID=1592317 RepID=A0A194AFV9_9BACT|nr:endonuclease III [Desulfoplanes formicivorans]GAU07654.1 endonuclease III [Desulfoplanes formicivorans]
MNSSHKQNNQQPTEVQARAAIVLDRLLKRYPRPTSALNWSTPWELLVATALSAQCTDKRVNMVTPVLFARWPDVASMAQADPREVEKVIYSTGFYKNKAKNLIHAARTIMNTFAGQVPQSMAELITLGGVARKTANIILSNAFGIHEGIAVDTHVKRIALRLGLTESTNPIRVEKDLMPLVPRQHWGNINHCLVLFGRKVCKARGPLCTACDLTDICPRIGIPSEDTSSKK